MAMRAISSVGQENPDFELRMLSTKDGLSHQNIYTVKQDFSGLLWIGTLYGLDIFNGLKFEHFDLQQNRHTNFPNKAIFDLEIGPDGFVFACTADGVRVIDPVYRKVVSGASLGIPDSLFQGRVEIEKNTSGDLFWLRNGVIYQLRYSASGRYSIQVRYVLPPCLIRQLLLDKSGTDSFWVITAKCGILHVRPEKGIAAINISYQGSDGTSQYSAASRFQVLQDNSLWDPAQLLFRYSNTSNSLKFVGNFIPQEFPALPHINAVLKHNTAVLTCFLQIGNKQQVYGTRSGLFIYRQKRPLPFRNVSELVGEEIRAIHPNPDNSWLAGTYTGIFSSKAGWLKSLKAPMRTAWQFMSLSDNRMLIASENRREILLWNTANHSVKALKFPTEQATDNGGGLSLCRDFRNGLWAGTYEHLKYARTGNLDSFDIYKDPLTGAPFFQSAIRALLVDQDSSIWTGSNQGLFHFIYDPGIGEFRLDLSPAYILGVPVSHIYQDRFGVLWVATKPKGFARINKRSGRVDWFNTNNGLSNNSVCRIESSHNGRVLWISTHNGLSRFDVLRQTFDNYYEEDGLICNEFNSAASAQLPNGNLLFGGVNGLTIFCPDSIPTAEFQHKVLLPHINIYNTELDILLSVPAKHTRIELPPYPEYVEIPLASNEFIRSQKIVFRYRLVGLSDLWSYTHGEQEIKYIRLPPGNYTFEIQALSLFGYPSEVQQLLIKVNAPFYETWWFYLLVVFAVGLVVYGVFRYRIGQMEKVQIIRQQIADDLHDDIGNKLNIIGILTQKIARSTAFNDNETAKSAVQKLIIAGRETLASLQTMIWTIDANKGQRLADLISRMQDFTDSYLLPLHISCTFEIPRNLPETDMNLHVRHHLMLLYQETLTNMIKHANPKKIETKIRLTSPTALELTIINTLDPDIKTEHLISSTKRGAKSIKRRLQQVNGSLIRYELSSENQIIRLYFPDIFR